MIVYIWTAFIWKHNLLFCCSGLLFSSFCCLNNCYFLQYSKLWCRIKMTNFSTFSAFSLIDINYYFTIFRRRTNIFLTRCCEITLKRNYDQMLFLTCFRFRLTYFEYWITLSVTKDGKNSQFSKSLELKWWIPVLLNEFIAVVPHFSNKLA